MSVSSRNDRVDSIIQAYYQAVEAGGDHDWRCLLTRYPEYAAELEMFFVDQEKVEKFVGVSPTPRTSSNRPCAAFSESTPTHVSRHERPVAPPRSFADYELLEILNEGGMGIVWKARQISLNRLVALKMIRWGSWALEEDSRRFRLEAEAVAQLNHP